MSGPRPAVHALAREPGLEEPSLVGLEHEFTVRCRSAPVEFRQVVHRLGLGQPNLDPADPNAYRLPSGAAVTSDGAEAEIALPPLTVQPGFTIEMVARAADERDALEDRLGPDYRLEGYSTHLSIGVPDDLAEPICRMYATRFSAAMILMIDRSDSPGLLIRPRPGRVELCGEFAEANRLAAAALFAVASVKACEAALSVGDARPLPEALAVRVEPAVARYGWYVDRAAFGGDLLADGRDAPLRTADGIPTTAQDVLSGCWEAARHLLLDLADVDELNLVQGVIDGAWYLPSEPGAQESVVPMTSRAQLPLTAYGSALVPRRRPAFEIAPVMLTWELAVFLILDRRRRRRFAAVRGNELASFLSALDSGGLDLEITRCLRRRRGIRRLDSWTQVDSPGLYGQLGRRIHLIHPELPLDGQLMTSLAS